jgi:Zn-dependent peptidase ImmA (M78 family)
VEKIADFLLELNLDWDEIHKPGVLAYLKPATKTITMNSLQRDFFDEHFGTEQFTLAHEVGHWELHVFDSDLLQGLLIGENLSKAFVCRNNQKDRMEIQANIFASHLLMPRRLLLPAMQGVKIDWPLLYDLRDHFQVSITALCKRLEALGVLFVSEDGKIYSSEAEAHGQMKLF